MLGSWHIKIQLSHVLVAPHVGACMKQYFSGISETRLPPNNRIFKTADIVSNLETSATQKFTLGQIFIYICFLLIPT